MSELLEWDDLLDILLHRYGKMEGASISIGHWMGLFDESDQLVFSPYINIGIDELHRYKQMRDEARLIERRVTQPVLVATDTTYAE